MCSLLSVLTGPPDVPHTPHLPQPAHGPTIPSYFPYSGGKMGPTKLWESPHPQGGYYGHPPSPYQHHLAGIWAPKGQGPAAGLWNPDEKSLDGLLPICNCHFEIIDLIHNKQLYTIIILFQPWCNSWSGSFWNCTIAHTKYYYNLMLFSPFMHAMYIIIYGYNCCKAWSCCNLCSDYITHHTKGCTYTHIQM